MSLNLSAVAVRERAVTLFFILLLADHGCLLPSSCSDGRRTPFSPSRP